VPVFSGSGGTEQTSKPRSRFGWRCSRRQGTGALKVKLPETPLILAGALGGPLCIFCLTPLRNALTLASQDSSSTAPELYANVFASGFSAGWTGGLACVIPSCPQFIVMGPLFHFLKAATGSAAAAVPFCALAETFISYGSQTVNAQMAFNSEQDLAQSGNQVEVWNPLIPFGPGSSLHVLRNIVALSGMRIFSGPCQAMLPGALRKTPALLQLLGDFIASMGSAILSAPLNQLYNFAVTTNAFLAAASATTKVELAIGFLDSQYFLHDASGAKVGISPTLPRDLVMRCAYVATLYAIFGAIERMFSAAWKLRESRRC